MLRYIISVFFFFLFFFSFSKETRLEQIIAASEVHTDKDEYEQAITLLKDYLEELEEVEMTAIASIQHKLGVNYYYSDQFKQAIAAVSQAIQLRSKVLGEEHPSTQNSLFLRSVIYRYIGKLEEALNDLEKNIAYISKYPSLSDLERDSILAGRYNELGNLYLNLQDHHNAIFYWEQVRNYRIQKYGANHLNVFQIEDQLATAYKNIGQYELAIEYFEKAIQFYKKAKPVLHSDLCIVYNNIASTYELLGNERLGITYYQKAVESCKEIDDKTNLLEAYINQINSYTNVSNYAAAQKAFDNGIELSNEVSSALYKANLYNNLGQLSAARGQKKDALKYFDVAIEILVPDFKATTTTPTPDPTQYNISAKHQLLNPLSRKAMVFVQLSKHEKNGTSLKKALQIYECIDLLVTTIRIEYSGGKSKFLLLKRSSQWYEKAIAVAIELYEQTKEKQYLEKAYQFSAKNKASVLLDALQDDSAKDFAGLPKSILEEEKKWKQAINEQETLLYEAQSSGKKKLNIYRDSLFQLRQSYKKFVQALEIEYPDYYELKYAFASSPKIEEIQKKIAPKTALLEYFLGDSTAYVFLITPSLFEVIPIQNKLLLEDLEAFRSLCIAPLSSNKEKENFLKLAYKNYQFLLADALAKIPNTERLILIPDGILAQISFDALLYEASENVSNTSPFLLNRYAISYLYSSSFLLLNKQVQEAKECFGGFGIEYDDYTLESIKDKIISPDNQVNTSVRSMGELTYSDDEVIASSKLLAGRVWINEAATKSTFLEVANRFRILHLAMHGVLDEEYPLQSALIFTKTPEEKDHLLRAGELYNLRLQADLVVLSACNTATGQLNKGEGVRSLARAFQYAGAASLVASIWSAPDQTTKDITINFYQYLKDGFPKDIALQKAKLAYLKDSNTSPEYAHPSYWAHLIAIGDMDYLSFKTNAWIWWIVGFGVLLVLGFFLRNYL